MSLQSIDSMGHDVITRSHFAGVIVRLSIEDPPAKKGLEQSHDFICLQ